jgi:hypothetical protein
MDKHEHDGEQRRPEGVPPVEPGRPDDPGRPPNVPPDHPGRPVKPGRPHAAIL